MGLATLSALVVANMIGAGIFTSSGFSLAALGNPGRVMLAWWVCGVWAVCGAIAYGSLVSRLPMSGGEYLFLSRFVHPAVGFLAGWISIIAGFTAPIAAAALGAAAYSIPGSDGTGELRIKLIAAAVIVAATLCHLVGISIGVGTQNLIVLAKLLLLSVIVIWAFSFTSTSDWQGTALADRDPNWLPGDWSAWWVFAGSMSWVALSYTGFNAAIYVAGESRNARTAVPRAMLVATLLVTVIYLLLNYVFVYAPAPEAVAGQPDVAAIAGRSVGGASLEWVIRLTIVLAMTSSVFAMLLTGPRVYQRMADDGVMPKLFRSRGGSPRAATLVQASLSIAALFVADLLQLMSYLGLTLSACGALAVLSLWWVRTKLPDAAALHLREIVATVVYLSITACIVVASVTEHPAEFRAMLFTFAFGLFVYVTWLAFDSRLGKSSDMKPDHAP